MTTVTVYTKPSCVQCEATKRRLDQREIAYTAIDVTENEEARKMLEDKGITGLPYVVTDHGTWTGFRDDRIKGLVSHDGDQR